MSSKTESAENEEIVHHFAGGVLNNGNDDLSTTSSPKILSITHRSENHEAVTGY